MIVQTNTVTVETQSGDGVQEAGGQTAQTAVAQRGLGFDLLNQGQIVARLGEDGADLVKDAESQQIVGQQLAHEELSGEVVELALALGSGLGSGQLLSQLKQGVIDFLAAAILQGTLAAFGENFLQTGFDFHNI